jgi:hypothetical protein
LISDYGVGPSLSELPWGYLRVRLAAQLHQKEKLGDAGLERKGGGESAPRHTLGMMNDFTCADFTCAPL